MSWDWKNNENSGPETIAQRERREAEKTADERANSALEVMRQAVEQVRQNPEDKDMLEALRKLALDYTKFTERVRNDPDRFATNPNAVRSMAFRIQDEFFKGKK